MNPIITRILNSTAEAETKTSGSTESIKTALKNMVTHPAFYITIGAIIILIIAVYLIRRIVKPTPNVVTIVTRKGEIYKLVDEKSSKYFRVPFADKVGVVITLGERELNSDKLFINNGPDALYQVNYTLKYKVTDPKGFYKYCNNINDLIISKLNDNLREFADRGNALILVKDFRDNSSLILDLINKAINEYNVEVVAFKINLIQPLGR